MKREKKEKLRKYLQVLDTKRRRKDKLSRVDGGEKLFDREVRNAQKQCGKDQTNVMHE